MTDIVERLHVHDIADCDEAADEIERLRALKTPASRQLLNITKGCLDNAENEVEELRAAIKYAKQAAGNVLYMPIEFAEKAAAEIERLRAALQKIAAIDYDHQTMNDIARLALKGEAHDRLDRSHANLRGAYPGDQGSG